MPKQATPEQNAAYIAHLCIGLCGRRHAAGRPRCDACDKKRYDNKEATA